MTSEMGSTSYIIPLRSESDEENEVLETRPRPTEPVTVAFRNKITPTSPTQTQIEPVVRSRSPLFRAKSSEYDRSCPSGTEMVGGVTVAADSDKKDFDAAKMKRSAFSDKSNSTVGVSNNSYDSSGPGIASIQSPLKSSRSQSAKSSNKS